MKTNVIKNNIQTSLLFNFYLFPYNTELKCLKLIILSLRVIQFLHHEDF